MNIFTFLKKAVRAVKEKVNNQIKIATSCAEKQKLVKALGVSLGIILCVTVISFFFTPAYEVYLGSEKVATVAKKTDFEKSLVNADKEIEKIAGRGYGITKIPNYVFTIALKSKTSSQEEMIYNVMSTSTAVVPVYRVWVDGRSVCSTVSEEAAQKFINRAAVIYGDENNEILNKIEIKPDFELMKNVSTAYQAVSSLKEVLTVKSEKQQIYTADILCETTKKPTKALYVNEEEVSYLGENGAMEVEAKVTLINGKATDTTVVSQKVIKEPVNKIVMVGTKEIPSVGTGEFTVPFYGTITSRYGSRWGGRHTGTDICGTVGEPIKSADNGIVTVAEYQENGYGNIIIIDHQNGLETWYAHLDSIGVKQGQTVKKGETIGTLGNTGRSTGPHLHFEVRKDGCPVNPSKYLEYLK